MPKYQLFIYDERHTGGTYVRDNIRILEPEESYTFDSIEEADAVVRELREAYPDARETYLLYELGLGSFDLGYTKGYYPAKVPCSRCGREYDPDDLVYALHKGDREDLCELCYRKELDEFFSG